VCYTDAKGTLEQCKTGDFLKPLQGGIAILYPKQALPLK
jgi:hypothetical protein